MKFTDLDLKPKILAALRDIQYVNLTPVQEKTFPYILAGRDIIAKAETGSGKTAACAIPIVQMVDTSLKAVLTLFTKRHLRNLKAIINTNCIQPIWQGAEPDLKNISRPRKSSRRPSRNYRPRRKK